MAHQTLQQVKLCVCVCVWLNKIMIAPNYWLQLSFGDSFLSMCQSVCLWHKVNSNVNMADKQVKDPVYAEVDGT